MWAVGGMWGWGGGAGRRGSQRKSEGAFRGANPHLARHSWKVLSPLGFQFSIRSLFRALSKGGITSSAVVVFSLGYMQIYFLRNMLAALKKSISRSSNSVFSKTAWERDWIHNTLPHLTEGKHSPCSGMLHWGVNPCHPWKSGVQPPMTRGPRCLPVPVRANLGLSEMFWIQNWRVFMTHVIFKNVTGIFP